MAKTGPGWLISYAQPGGAWCFTLEKEPAFRDPPGKSKTLCGAMTDGEKMPGHENCDFLRCGNCSEILERAAVPVLSGEKNAPA